MEQEDQLQLDRQLSFLLSQIGASALPLHLKQIEAEWNLVKDHKLKNSKSAISSSQKKSNVKRPEFRCNYCGRVKRSLPELVLHERIHTGDKPYSCRLCSRKFLWKHCLESHEKIYHRVVRKKKATSAKTSGDEPTTKETQAQFIKTDENETSQVDQEFNEDYNDVSAPDLKDSENNVDGPSAHINSVKLEGVAQTKVVEGEPLLEHQNQNPSLIKRYKCSSCPQRFILILACRVHRLSHNSNSSSSTTQLNELKTENTSTTASNPKSTVKQPEAPKAKIKYRKGGRGFMRNMTIIKKKTPSAAAAASAYYQSKLIRNKQKTEKQHQKQK